MTSEQPQPLTEAERRELAVLMAKAERGGLDHRNFERAAQLNARQDATEGTASGAAW